MVTSFSNDPSSGIEFIKERSLVKIDYLRPNGTSFALHEDGGAALVQTNTKKKYEESRRRKKTKEEVMKA